MPQLEDTVVVIDGPFEDFDGVIKRINGETGKIIVSISFFGREHPVELTKAQIRKWYNEELPH